MNSGKQEVYENKRTGVIARFVNRNDGNNEVTLQSLADGSNIAITVSTFRRWWKLKECLKPVDDVLSELVAASGKRVYVDDAVKAIRNAGYPNADLEYVRKYLERAYSISGTESGSDSAANPKLADVMMEKQVLIQVARSMGFTCRVYESTPTAIGFCIKVPKRKNPVMVVDASVGRKYCRLRMKSSVIPDGVKFRSQNYMLDAALNYFYGDEKKLMEILSWSKKEVA